MNDLSTCQGKYTEKEPIRLLLQHDTIADRADWRIFHLEKETVSGSIPVIAAELELLLPPLEPGGYGVEVGLYREKSLLMQLYTAVNVGGNVVRYGFLCDFQHHDEAAISALAKCHITHVQYYDWSWKHDTLVALQNEYEDMMGKHNSLPVIKQRIAACHQHGMLAMAYGAVYASCREFRETHPSWGLYNAAGEPMAFINTFYYMDIESPWRNHLINEYEKAIRDVGFDGIHMDTYGEPKRAFSENGTIRSLRNSFPAIIRDTHDYLLKHGIQPHLTFNNVGTWPVEDTRDCPQDAVYMELWPPMDRYCHLQAAIQKGGNHPIVLAAYPAAFRTDIPERAMYSQMILSSAIAMHGATQLFLGEKNAVVTQGYYADYTVLTKEQINRIRSYEDFFVRYGDLLYDRSLKDVTYTHFGGDNVEYRIETPCSPDGEQGKLWISIRENEQRKIVGFVNLCGNEEDHWSTGKNKPQIQKGIILHVLTEKEPETVWYASPDDRSGSPVPLQHTATHQQYGLEITFTIPSIFCCGLVWI